MADIELVVKIPYEDYKKISNSNPSYAEDFSIYYAIKNGTPLPKGHGDLIDKSLLYPDSDYDDGLFYAVSIGQINGAPTLIEADTAESEE